MGATRRCVLLLYAFSCWGVAAGRRLRAHQHAPYPRLPIGCLSRDTPATSRGTAICALFQRGASLELPRPRILPRYRPTPVVGVDSFPHASWSRDTGSAGLCETPGECATDGEVPIDKRQGTSPELWQRVHDVEGPVCWSADRS